MPSAFDQQFETYAAPQFDKQFGVSVVLVRGPDESESFIATWEQNKREVLDNDGMPRVDARSRVWRFDKTLAVIDDVAVEPRSGDVLREVDTGSQHELMSADASPAAMLDDGEYRWVVQTKQVA